jgi:hypothetical protein
MQASAKKNWTRNHNGTNMGHMTNEKSRPRIYIRPELVRLAGLNRRSVPLEIETAIDRHLLENAAYLKKGPKLRKQ